MPSMCVTPSLDLWLACQKRRGCQSRTLSAATDRNVALAAPTNIISARLGRQVGAVWIWCRARYEIIERGCRFNA